MKKKLTLLLIVTMLLILAPTSLSAAPPDNSFEGLSITYVETSVSNVFRLDVRAHGKAGNTFVLAFGYDRTMVKPVQPDGQPVFENPESETSWMSISQAMQAMPNGIGLNPNDSNTSVTGWAELYGPTSVADEYKNADPNFLRYRVATYLDPAKRDNYSDPNDTFNGIINTTAGKYGKYVITPPAEGLGLFSLYFSPVGNYTLADISRSTFEVFDGGQDSLTGASIIDFGNIVADGIHWDFTNVSHLIKASADTGGSITPSGNVYVSDGADQSFTIQADVGMAIDRITIDGATLVPNVAGKTNHEYTFTNVKADATIHAEFGLAPPLILVPQPDDEYTTARPMFVGTAVPGATVTLTVKAGSDGNGAAQYLGTTSEATANENGVWIFKPDADLAVGPYTVEAYQTTPAGEQSVTSAYVPFRIIAHGGQRPDAPVITNPKDQDKIPGNDVTIEGTGVAGATVHVRIFPRGEDTPYIEKNNIAVDASGNWSWPVTLDYDEYIVMATQTVNTVTSDNSFPVIFSMIPAAPVITLPLNNAVITGTGVMITGTAEPNIPIQLSVINKNNASWKIDVTVSVDASGNWAYNASYPYSTYEASATQTIDGMTSNKSNIVTFTTRGGGGPIDPGHAPTIDYPADNAVINSKNVRIGGTATADVTVRLTIGKKNDSGWSLVREVQSDASGNWSYSGSLDYDVYTVYAVEVVNGSAGPRSNLVNFTLRDNGSSVLTEEGNHPRYLYGYPDGTIRPDNNIAREEVATIFYRLSTDEFREEYETTKLPYPDVESDRWSRKYVATLTNGGILIGYPDGGYHPADNITRAEFCTMAVRYGGADAEPYKGNFSDVSGHWAEGSIIAAAEKGWVNGYEEGDFRPDRPITRAETAAIVNRMFQRKVDEQGLLRSLVTTWPDIVENHWAYYDMLEALISHEYSRRVEGQLMENWTGKGTDLTFENM